MDCYMKTYVHWTAIPGINKYYLYRFLGIFQNISKIMLNPVISYDEQYVAFSANDGNIWIRTLKSEVPEFTQITNIDKYEKNIYPFWTNNPNELYYINQMDITGSYYYYLYAFIF